MHRARVRVRGSPGPPRVRAARSRVTRAAPSSGVNLRRAPPREAVRLRQALLRDADTKLRLLAVLCVPTKGPRLRAHRLVRASGRAAAGAAQPAGTMAPFARNDKTILEIALPALVGFNASVSFKQLALLMPRRRRACCRATHRGDGSSEDRRRACRGRRSTEGGAGLQSRRRCDTRLPTPSSWRERATHSTQHTARGARGREREHAITP